MCFGDNASGRNMSHGVSVGVTHRNISDGTCQCVRKGLYSAWPLSQKLEASEQQARFSECLGDPTAGQAVTHSEPARPFTPLLCVSSWVSNRPTHIREILETLHRYEVKEIHYCSMGYMEGVQHVFQIWKTMDSSIHETVYMRKSIES